MSLLRGSWKIVEWVSHADPDSGELITKFSVHYNYGLIDRSYGPFNNRIAADVALAGLRKLQCSNET